MIQMRWKKEEGDVRCWKGDWVGPWWREEMMVREWGYTDLLQLNL
jgi:hypothetical protein